MRWGILRCRPCGREVAVANVAAYSGRFDCQTCIRCGRNMELERRPPPRHLHTGPGVDVSWCWDDPCELIVP